MSPRPFHVIYTPQFFERKMKLCTQESLGACCLSYYLPYLTNFDKFSLFQTWVQTSPWFFWGYMCGKWCFKHIKSLGYQQTPLFLKSLACFFELPLALSNTIRQMWHFQNKNGQALDFFEHLPLVNDGPRTRNCCGTNTPHTFLCFRWGTICHLE